MPYSIYRVNITEMRQPAKVFAAAGRRLIAISRRGKTVGYILPEEMMRGRDQRPDEVVAAILKLAEDTQG